MRIYKVIRGWDITDFTVCTGREQFDLKDCNKYDLEFIQLIHIQDKQYVGIFRFTGIGFA